MKFVVLINFPLWIEQFEAIADMYQWDAWVCLVNLTIQMLTCSPISIKYKIMYTMVVLCEAYFD